jgi:hypothetical protein
MTNKKYVYVFVRKDLTPEQRAVQACHAALECGIFYNIENKYSIINSDTLVLIGVKNEKELDDAFTYSINNQILATMFVEPDLEYSNTAFATVPITEDKRIIFENYRTLRYERGILYYLKIFFRSIKNEIFE